MNHVYEQALALRLKGYSYNEINDKLGVAKSTLSGWFSRIKLSEKAIERLKGRVAQGTLRGLIARNKRQTVIARQRADKIRIDSSKEIRELSSNDLLIIVTALYWAEGYKRLKNVKGREVTAHVVALTNSDPEIVSAFILFLRKIIGVMNDKIVIEMRLFKHINQIKAIKYWMDVTGLPRSSFRKPRYPISSASKGIRPRNRLPYGTVQVIVSDTRLFYRILGYIDGLKARLGIMIKKNLPR